MGLTAKSTGYKTFDTGLCLQKRTPQDKIIAVAGNPNVGKSTLFNSLTGLKQHTGNWAGKTIASAQGYCKSDKYSYVLVDIPGTCSLVPHSAEEEVARDFLCFSKTDAVVVVCDATCLERGMNLLLQVLELTSFVVLCVNLMDEAARRNIVLDLKKLEKLLGIPVIGTIAHSQQSKEEFLRALDRVVEIQDNSSAFHPTYEPVTEKALSLLQNGLSEYLSAPDNKRWISLMLLEDHPLCGISSSIRPKAKILCEEAWKILHQNGYTQETFSEYIVTQIAHTSAAICKEVVSYKSCCATSCPHCCHKNPDTSPESRDRRLDKFLTSPITGYPVMMFFLLLLFWITIVGANYPSRLFSWIFSWGESVLDQFLLLCKLPTLLREALVYGIFRTVGWVVSVMLPPMMIFFPLFTLLEDAGYLPRVAYNLDYCFQKCRSCGKQALTMAMGFGCNAAGVVGCRIIDSPRERLIAMLTNCFVPCNGRFPMLIAIIGMFLLSGKPSGNLSYMEGAGMGTSALASSLIGAFCLTVLILIGIFMTFLTSAILSSTLLRGVPSSFVLELPPYRKPKAGSVLIHSLTDRVSFLLGRALITAAPAGLMLWFMANLTLHGTSLINLVSGFLDPFARLLGLDGVILMAFILGLPANEIVLPIILMTYASQGSLQQTTELQEMKQLLTANGWTWKTAVSTCLFSLMHWPCATTILTIRKETGSIKWTLLSILLPAICGFLICMLFTALV